VGRFWSILFLLVPILGVWVFVAAANGSWPFGEDHWLPVNYSLKGRTIDSLFYFILYLTGAIFLGTGLVQFWFMWKYDAEKNDKPVKFSHGNHSLEIIWSIIPATTLLFIAIVQMNSWAAAKTRRPVESPGPDQVEGTADDILQKPLAEVTGRQFEWRIRYPGPDGEMYTADDLQVVNELHVPSNEMVGVAIKSDDVRHSLFLPHLRIKQDVVPGMKQYVWFRADVPEGRTVKHDIVCAELCGWGHYKMKGQIIIQPREKFIEWRSRAYQEQQQWQYTAPGGDDD